MNKQQAEELIGHVFLAFPLYRKWLNETEDPNGTLDVWCETLLPVESEDAMDVVADMKVGKFPLPAGYERDQLAIVIRREAGERAASRRQKQTQEEKYHNQSKGAWSAIANDQSGHIAIELGVAVREGRLTREENDRRMKELMAWDRGGKKPEWV